MSHTQSAAQTGAQAATALPVFSRPFRVDQVREGGNAVSILAKPNECRDLAKANDLARLDSLKADLVVTRRGRSGVRVKGILNAKITQVCVVSLDPFDADITETINVTFAPQSQSAAALANAQIEALRQGNGQGNNTALQPGVIAEMADPPDPIIDGQIDLGALVAEFLALGLDPYPRKPGVSFTEAIFEGGPAPAPITTSPFSVLKQMGARKG